MIVTVISLAGWTLFSPTVLVPQSQESLSGSLFQFAKTTSQVNITDGEGSYTFLFGVDYNETVSAGIPSIVEAFVSLQYEVKTSDFLRGASLEIDSSSVLIDGHEDGGVNSMVSASGGLITDRLSNVFINETSGNHTLTVRLLVSNVDVNYIGYFPGDEELVVLNGTVSIV